MKPFRTSCRAALCLIALACVSGLSRAGDDSKKDLVADLAGSDEQARALARQLLPRQCVDVLPRVLPLLNDENVAVKEAAYQVLLDLANEASAPGREADRIKAASEVMTLLKSDQ